MQDVESITKERVRELITKAGYNDTTDTLSLDEILEAIMIDVQSQREFENQLREVITNLKENDTVRCFQ